MNWALQIDINVVCHLCNQPMPRDYVLPKGPSQAFPEQGNLNSGVG